VTRPKSEPSSAPSCADTIQQGSERPASAPKDTQTPATDLPTEAETSGTTQPDDPEEAELKEDISQLAEEKARLKKELNDSQPPGSTSPIPS